MEHSSLAVNEKCIEAVKVLKMYGWTDALQRRVEDSLGFEFHSMMFHAYSRLSAFLFWK